MKTMTRKKKRESEGRKNYGVSAEQFAMTWTESNSAQEVSEKLGMPEPIVLARASGYRKSGMQLKKMRRKDPRRIDVDGINAKIEEKLASLAGQEVGSSTQEIVQTLLGVPTEVLAKALSMKLGHEK